MKSFFKIFLAVILAGVTFVFLGFFFLMTISALGESKPEVSENSILKIDFDAEIVERSFDDPFGSFDFLTQSSTSTIGIDQIKSSLKNAAEDDRIKAVFLNFSGFQAAPASLKEVYNSLLEFKQESGKPIYSYSEIYTQKAIYLASLSDSIMIQPRGMVELSGMNANVAYYKNMFSKVGIKPEIIRGSNNKFKSAVEPFILDSMSASNRLQLETLFGDIWGEYKEIVALNRNLSPTDIQAISDDFAVQSSKMALDKGIVDVRWYQDEVESFFKKLTNVEEDGKTKYINYKTYLTANPEKRNSSKNRIAVIYAVGDIMSGEGSESTIGSATVAKAIHKAANNDRVKAIVLRVNSPGGSALASDVIWREMTQAKEKKPVVVSMGDYAASGGYYISAPADTIIAQSNTITGSIGIFMTLFTAEELIEEKIGVHYDNVKTSEYADLFSLNRSLNENEKRKLQMMVDEGYGDFLGLVSAGRELDSSYVDSIGQGRVWSGKRAMELGLVDLEGGLDYAIEVAAEMAELEDYKLMNLPRFETGLQKILNSLNASSVKQEVLEEELGEFYQYLEMVQKVKSWEGPQARMEFELMMN